MNPIKSDPDLLGGAPCFAGTRVPIKNLFDYHERGRDLDFFLKQFPSVTRDQALAVLELTVTRNLITEPRRGDM